MKLFKLKELKFKNEKNKILHSIRNRYGGVEQNKELKKILYEHF